MLPVLRVLAGLRRLRGTWLDPFRLSADRQLERDLLARYEALLERLERELDDARFELALQLASLPHEVRGYGPIKKAAAQRAKATETKLWTAWEAAQAVRGVRGSRARHRR